MKFEFMNVALDIPGIFYKNLNSILFSQQANNFYLTLNL